MICLGEKSICAGLVCHRKVWERGTLLTFKLDSCTRICLLKRGLAREASAENNLFVLLGIPY
jgi:hypothetical protein